MRAQQLAIAAMAIALGVLFSSNSHAQCADELIAQVPEAQLKNGGLFYRATRSNEDHWEALRATNFAISGNLSLTFVVPTQLCAGADGTKRDDCGPDGYFLLKTHKKTAARGPDTINLSHGDQYSKVTGFKGAHVGNAPYQSFHLDERTLAWKYRQEWHRTYQVNGENRATFLPIEKKLQFAFEDELLGDGFRSARLFRFETPPPGSIVCVPFGITWYEGMTLTAEFVLLEPVFDSDGFQPKKLILTNSADSP